MRIERDAQHDVLYIELREGEAERTVDLDDGVHMDLDDEGRVLGVEFLSLGAFERYLERHNGQVDIPERDGRVCFDHDGIRREYMFLPDYMYLDISRLQNYMSTLEPGEIEQFTQTTRALSDKEGQAGFKASVMGAGVDAGVGGHSQEETTNERQLRITAQHMFGRVYEELEKADLIKVFDEDDPLNPDSVKRRDVVEITRSFSPSPLNEAIDGIMKLMGVMEQMGFIEEVSSKDLEMVRAMAMIFRGDEGKEEVPMVARGGQDEPSVVFLAKSRYVLVDQDEFEGPMTVFGKVQKWVPQNASIDLFDFLKLPKAVRGEANLKKDLLEMFSSWPNELGGPVAKESIQIPGPAMIVTPVAAYEG